MNKTGWPPGLLQDDCRALSLWFASRLGARWLLDHHSDQSFTTTQIAVLSFINEFREREKETMMDLTKAASDVLAERRRQVEAEGFDIAHDDEHKDGGMAFAAAAYAVLSAGHTKNSFFVVSLWKWTGWATDWLKPKDTRHNLIRAAALLLAEIERLDRADTASRHAAAAPWLK